MTDLTTRIAALEAAEAKATESLLPCPFCGSGAMFEHLENGSWSIGCADIDGDCMGFQSLQSFATKTEAIAAWNNRAPSDAFAIIREQQAEIARLREALRPFAAAAVPACRIKLGAERGLVMALRKAEEECDRLMHLIADECTDAAKAYYAEMSRHRAQMIEAEEAGYERGLADGRKEPNP